MAQTHGRAFAAIRRWGLTLPGAHRKSPWPEHDDLAVHGKTFGFMSAPGRPPTLSCKLTASREAALQLAYAQPTGYGLGRSGWVTFDFSQAGEVPVEQVKRWLLESYRCVAPKKLVKELEALQPWTRAGAVG